MYNKLEDRANSTANTIDVETFYENIFLRANLLISKEDQKKIRSSKVAVIGLGGIGSIAAEMIIRMGVGTIGLADVDYYEPTNLNRQLFSTFLNAYGPNHGESDKKARIAEARIKSINPFCETVVIADGINNTNVEEFCSQFDVIVCQPDRESIKVMVHRMAKKYSIPLITSSRTNCNGNRWTLSPRVWNYKDDPDLITFEETNHRDLMQYSLEELTAEVIDEFDRKDHQKVKTRWKEIIDSNQVNKYGLIDQANAQKVTEEIPHMFHKSHIIAPIANIAGAMASIKVFKLLLGANTKPFALDFWNGESVTVQY